jgi:hypothetical protein
MSRIFTIAVGTAGYVLGARAGRERYEQIKTQAGKLWSSPTVQQAASGAQDVASKASSKVSRSKKSADEPDLDADLDLDHVEFPATPATTPGGVAHG